MCKVSKVIFPINLIGEKMTRTLKLYKNIILLSLTLINFLSSVSKPQTADEIYNKFSKRYHIYKTTRIPYYIFVPANYNPSLKYPLVLGLHGSGESGDNPSAVKLNSLATVWAKDANQFKFPCFILIPQCPANAWWGGDGLLPVSEILDSILIEFSIDTNRIYITGLSMGGYGTWEFITRFPDKFAAAVPMSGGGDSSKAEIIKHIPIWNFHGEVDNVIPVANSRNMITALERHGRTVIYTDCYNDDCTGLPDSIITEKIKSGINLLYTEYRNAGHNIWNMAYYEPLLLPWVFSQNKTNNSTGIDKGNFNTLPREFILFQNYPNPFNPSTTIQFQIPNSSFVNLKVYDILGREVTTLVNEEKSAGVYEVEFNADDLSSGIYFYTLKAGKYLQTRKLILMK